MTAFKFPRFYLAVLVVAKTSSLAPPVYVEQVVNPATRGDVVENHQWSNSMSFSSLRGISIPSWQSMLGIPPAFAADIDPSNEDIKLLRAAFATFYSPDRNLAESEKLLSRAIDAWQNRPDDERAALYRVRGDCYTALQKMPEAEADYSVAIDLLNSPAGQQADESELPAALLGRARAIRSQGVQASSKQIEQACKDYQLSLRLSSREDWDTDAEKEEDGAMRNPYAAWEWGSELRLAGNVEEAARIHLLASDFFDDIGDRARSVISQIDAGVDLAASSQTDKAIKVLSNAIGRTTSVEGRNVELLQRVIAKEGEGRIALASLLWEKGDRMDAETQLSEACTRLDQLAADAYARNSKTGSSKEGGTFGSDGFSIDDLKGLGPLEISCSRFKNKDYVTKELQWPSQLLQKVGKLNSLK